MFSTGGIVSDILTTVKRHKIRNIPTTIPVVTEAIIPASKISIGGIHTRRLPLKWGKMGENGENLSVFVLY